MIFMVYQLFFPLVVVGVLIKLLFDGRGSILRETPRQIRQRLGLLSREELGCLRPAQERVLWIHAASVGEVNAAAPILEAILASSGRPRILLTTSTAAGLKHAKAMSSGPDLAILAPADFYLFVTVFLRRVRPDALLIMETELWPAMLRAAVNYNIRIAVANGRITERSFRRYRWIRKMVAPLLEKIAYAAVQTSEDASRFAALGLPESAIRVCGNLKNDIPAPTADERQGATKLIERMGWAGVPIWAAGSTWLDEEEALLSAFVRVRREIPNLKMILAPRHIERCAETERLLAKFQINYVLFSTVGLDGRPGVPASFDCLVLDRMGELRELYSACDVAFVGGTFNQAGGHNLLEPAMAGKPVLFGPNTQSIQDTAKILELGGGAIRVSDALELSAALKKLLSDRVLLESVGRHAAETAAHLPRAAQRTLEFLSPFLARK
jgi:3-deoxy-D-manno-octulosonic-acid transferase